MNAQPDGELLEFPPPTPADLHLTAPAEDVLSGAGSPAPAPEPPDETPGPPDPAVPVEGVLRVRATINLPGLRAGQEANVDPTIPYIAAALRSAALVPSE